ncbi:MAG: Ig-like domain-containing protein [Saprospiraceae bacterium]|nr:Ig-like domain-containing protein [Saprospiraceae bacterium]
MSCGKDKPEDIDKGKVQLLEAKVGTISILSEVIIPSDQIAINLVFDKMISPATVDAIKLEGNPGATTEQIVAQLSIDQKTITITPNQGFREGIKYVLSIPSTVKGLNGETFDGKNLTFEVENNPLVVDSLKIGGRLLEVSARNEGVDVNAKYTLYLSHDVDATILRKYITVSGGGSSLSVNVIRQGSGVYEVSTSSPMTLFREFRFRILEGLGTETGKAFMAKEYLIFTSFPNLTDDQLLDLVQEKTFQYFWEFGHPVSGMARERNTSGDVVTSGGSGFGIMAMIVAVERGFITRDQALGRWEIMLSFLRNADRFHGVWSHWMHGASGKVIPFSPKDHGGDLVESAFMIQGLITLRQYLNPNVSREAALITRINNLWNAVEWDWYTKNGQSVLYWHWSPNFDWDMNLPIRGHNEGLIVYVLAASSPSHSIEANVYKSGYARNGAIKNGNTYYTYKLPLGSGRGGPLFFTHYSFLGLDPRNLKDQYANYWEQNTNHTLINRAYCIANPQKYAGYSADCWGLTASDGNNGYSAHSPDNDRGVITPTAALSSMPYTPKESMAALRHFYYKLGDKTWGQYGFYDAFNQSANWYADSYLAIDQGPIVCMIENQRTGLLWNLFMSAPEIQSGLTKLGFTY